MMFKFTEEEESVLEDAINNQHASFEKLVSILHLNPKSSFQHADLRGVDFGESNLNGYDFSHADMRGSDLSSARIEHAIFPLDPSKRGFDDREQYTAYDTRFDEIVSARDLSDADDVDRLYETLTLHSKEFGFSKISGKELNDWKNIIPIDTKPIVTILIDNSGSMRGRPILIAACCALFAAKLLETFNISVEILGFTTAAWKGGMAREEWIRKNKPNLPGRLNVLRHIIYKGHHESVEDIKQNFGLMIREGILKENFDGEALWWAFKRLIKQGNSRKILLVLSDGAPVDDSTLSVNPSNYLDAHLKYVTGKIQESELVSLYAIGIGHSVQRYYNNFAKLRNFDDLLAVFSSILKAILHRNFTDQYKNGPIEDHNNFYSNELLERYAYLVNNKIENNWENLDFITTMAIQTRIMFGANDKFDLLYNSAYRKISDQYNIFLSSCRDKGNIDYLSDFLDYSARLCQFENADSNLKNEKILLNIELNVCSQLNRNLREKYISFSKFAETSKRLIELHLNENEKEEALSIFLKLDDFLETQNFTKDDIMSSVVIVQSIQNILKERDFLENEEELEVLLASVRNKMGAYGRQI